MSAYTLDSNILINLVRMYPRDIFSSLWDSIEGAASENHICICEAVLLEVKRGGDELHTWAKGIAGFTCGVTDEELVAVAEIASHHPGWVRGPVNGADPFVIAHAKVEKSVIVTEEGRKGAGTLDQNLKIPNVADEHAVVCVKFFDFVRTHGWHF